MSFFVTRPPEPVPGTWDGSTPCSDAIRATTGDTNAFPLPDGAGAAGGAADGSDAVGAGVSAGEAASAVAGSGVVSGSGALSWAGASAVALPPIWPSFVPT